MSASSSVFRWSATALCTRLSMAARHRCTENGGWHYVCIQNHFMLSVGDFFLYSRWLCLTFFTRGIRHEVDHNIVIIGLPFPASQRGLPLSTLTFPMWESLA